MPGKSEPARADGQILIYQDGATRLQVRLDGRTVWLTQGHIAELFQTTKQNVSLHLRNIFAEHELAADSVVKDSLTTAADGKRYRTLYYNLDAILAVGYRVRSARGTAFRQWATARLSELLVKGFVLDDERLKEGRSVGGDYFDELLERIRAIRASERMFYQKITDIYATSIDYDVTHALSQTFFATVQNKRISPGARDRRCLLPRRLANLLPRWPHGGRSPRGCPAMPWSGAIGSRLCSRLRLKRLWTRFRQTACRLCADASR
jgi:hypothetical protein